MRCENCGRALTPPGDPLCGSCLAELRAGSYSHSHEPETLFHLDSSLLDPVQHAKPDEETAA